MVPRGARISSLLVLLLVCIVATLEPIGVQPCEIRIGSPIAEARGDLPLVPPEGQVTVAAKLNPGQSLWVFAIEGAGQGRAATGVPGTIVIDPRRVSVRQWLATIKYRSALTLEGNLRTIWAIGVDGTVSAEIERRQRSGAPGIAIYVADLIYRCEHAVTVRTGTSPPATAPAPQAPTTPRTQTSKQAMVVRSTCGESQTLGEIVAEAERHFHSGHLAQALDVYRCAYTRLDSAQQKALDPQLPLTFWDRQPSIDALSRVTQAAYELFRPIRDRHRKD